MTRRLRPSEGSRAISGHRRREARARAGGRFARRRPAPSAGCARLAALALRSVPAVRVRGRGGAASVSAARARVVASTRSRDRARVYRWTNVSTCVIGCPAGFKEVDAERDLMSTADRRTDVICYAPGIVVRAGSSSSVGRHRGVYHTTDRRRVRLPRRCRAATLAMETSEDARAPAARSPTGVGSAVPDDVASRTT